MHTTRERTRLPGDRQPLFVGREAELARLQTGLERYGVAVVYGLPGMGKTALVRAFAARFPDDRLVVLDDVRRLEVPRGKKVLATSRVLLDDERDRFELRLGGLSENEAQALWRGLDELTGPAAGFVDAWERSRGHPALLRAAHGGRVDAMGPLEELAASLSPSARAIAHVLTLCGAPLAIRSLSDRAALQALIRELVAEVDAGGACTIAEAMRSAMPMDLGARDAAYSALAEILPQAGLDAAVCARELGRVLRALGRWEELQRFLLDRAVELIRAGAADRLVREIEAIPRAERHPEIEITHARALMLAPDLRRAREKLARLGPDPEVQISLAETAVLTAQLDEAEQSARIVLEHPRARHSQRTRAHVVIGSVLGYRGDLAAAQAWFARAEAEAPDRVECGKLALSLAFLLWQAQRDAEALEPMRRGQALLAQTAPGIYRDVMGPGIAAAVLARLGRFDEAQQHIAVTEASWRGSTSPRPRLVWRALRVQLAYERGARTRALDEIKAVADAFERAGDVLNQWWMNVLEGRLLFALGRRHAARALLAETARRAAASRARLLVDAVEWSYRQDPVEQVRSGAVPLISAAQRGGALEVKALLAARAEGPDHIVERIVEQLAEAILLRGQGRPDEARGILDRVAAEAAAHGVDADFLPALVDAVRAIRLIAAGQRSALRELPALDEFDVVVDARTHELRAGRRVIDLRRRPALRRILYLLAARSGGVMTKEELAGALWPAPYDPLVHDNALRVNLRHLRQLIAPARLVIEFADSGYRLLPPPRFAFVDEIDLSVS